MSKLSELEVSRSPKSAGKAEQMSTAIGPKTSNQNAAPVTPISTSRQSQPLGLNARRVISKRYSLKDAQGNPIEEWEDIVRRVVGHVSVAETDSKQRDEFYSAMTRIMLDREFIPNTPCLVNAGKSNGQLAACFVLNVPDSISGIMEHAKAAATNAALLHNIRHLIDDVHERDWSARYAAR